ncbi:unnamed protein product [Protopolystoma xenopodis]|uniref:Uncharacterized protein n=1 Tax=Protopolystoma xenopodis TaxID=117903 RepID=A0A448WGB1_9PLAT|nr:unnamed protein product [Protopolystoma xenopodis]
MAHSRLPSASMCPPSASEVADAASFVAKGLSGNSAVVSWAQLDATCEHTYTLSWRMSGATVASGTKEAGCETSRRTCEEEASPLAHGLRGLG